MTRDYFDFQVQHLSSTTNQLPEETSLQFCNMLMKRMKRVVKGLESQSKNITDKPFFRDGRLIDETVAIIPYSSKSASVTVVSALSAMSKDQVFEFQEIIRILYFQATFWSIRRYYPHIVVTISSAKDLATLKSLRLPYWKIIDLSRVFDQNAEPRTKGSVHGLPRESLLFVMKKLNGTVPSKDSWTDFNYVYFSEGDHVLQMRYASKLYNHLDSFEGLTALAPHRLQVRMWYFHSAWRFMHFSHRRYYMASHLWLFAGQ
jgi:hypothetical protein